MARKFFYRVFCGFFLGLSIFAPGFSGSIVAITLGIYQDLVRILSNPFKGLKKNILYCLPLAIGGAVSAVVFVLAFKFLVETYEKATYLLFVGLIAGNLPEIFKQIKKCGFKWRYLAGGAGAFAAALAFGIFSIGNFALGARAGWSSGLPWLAFSGLAGGAALLVPGMSASMILILMGVYGQLLLGAESFLRLDFAWLLPFALFCLCAAAGLALAARGIKAVFEKAPGFANSMVLGFVAGSLLGVLIQSLRMEDPRFTWLQGGIMLAAGLGVCVLFVVLGRVMDKGETAARTSSS